MPPKANLTKRYIDALKPPTAADREYHYDAKTSGLALCITRTGAASWYVYKRVNGRPERIRLGAWPDLTVENARKAAALALAEIAQGGNPQDKKRQARATMTLGELFEWFLENHAKPHKKTWREDEQQFARYLTHWKARTITSINRGDVQALHTKIGEQHGKYAANRLRTLLRTMYARAADLGYDRANPVDGIKKFREQSRERFLRGDELPALFEALEQEPSETGRDFVWLCLLTGARRGNVMAMQWADVNLDRAEWRIPETKNGAALTVALVPKAVEILRTRWGSAQADKREKARLWVFPGKGASGHLMDPTKPWKAILARAGLSGVRVHDLRRTLGSWQAATGASLPIIGKSLGHKSAQATSIYARLDIDPVRQAVETATAAMLAAGNMKRGADDEQE